MYLKILLKTLKLNLKSQMDYKVNFFGDFIMTMCYYIFTISIFKIIFSYTTSFKGWTFQDFYLSFLVFISINFILETISDSLYEFFENLFSGKIDTYLCKPLNLSFIVIFSYLQPLKLLFSIIFISYLYYYIFINNLFLSINHAIFFSASLIVYMIICICFTFIFHSLNIFSDKNLYIGYYQYHIMQLCFIPPNTYGRNIFKILFMTAPFILCSSVPIFILTHQKIHLLYYSFIPMFIMVSISIYLLKSYKKLLKSFGG
ncbi:hypothetical protein GCL60_14345 [Silvanigrella paludirubra]|uniref:Uncharacterized protein n=1 Tax=Silvanigrella paludirubra TaxID=2499159 RepID=A0A6N6VRS2_9BACT|nr:ABC-2 family transporter protein [Silvanigrella paludirubra]KAB8037010.1 hypothetical protein GCL60_14345 [Silvanigrella paludirubra]